jgi:hypothetical protein
VYNRQRRQSAVRVANGDDQIELRGLNDRQVGGLSALADTAGIDAELAISVGEARALTHQAAGRREVRKRIDAGYPIACRQGRDLLASVDEEAIGADRDELAAPHNEEFPRPSSRQNTQLVRNADPDRWSSVMTMLSFAPIGLVGRELSSRGWAGWVLLRHWIHRRVSILCRLQIKRINSHHFDRGIRTRLCRHEDHGRHAAINWERQFLDQFFVGHYLIVSGRQYAIEALQSERLPEEDILAVRTRDHQDPPLCIIEKKRRIFEDAWLFNFIQMTLAKERTLSAIEVLPIGSGC